MAGTLPGESQWFAGFPAFEWIRETWAWLASHGMDFETATERIQYVCALRPEGAAPDEIVQYWQSAYGVPAQDAERVLQLAALLAHCGRIRRVQGGRYGADPAPVATFALVRFPETARALLGPYVYRGASWVAGPEDRP